MDKQWHYVSKGVEGGPVTEAELIGLFEKRLLGRDTEIWTEGMEEWVSVSKHSPKVPVGVYEALGGPLLTQVSREVTQQRPWVRFIARQFDQIIYGVAFMLLLAPVAEYLELVPRIFVLGLYLFLIGIIEGGFLALLGTTPGKGLLGTSVRMKGGEKLDFASGFSRTMDVMFRGMGLWAFCVPLITFWFGYRNLMRKGEATWDASGDYVVIHRRIHPIEWGLAIVFILALAFLAATITLSEF